MNHEAQTSERLSFYLFIVILAMLAIVELNFCDAGTVSRQNSTSEKLKNESTIHQKY
ncbi:hypothetical protein [Chryseobacterium sp. SC28]|uniref:hypothetical protein n=1 Tax=Chryseobacterium sp. SC28 TaxID=2268028 RepID=UPI0016264B81|nr:hypothetical protein [Chryseobacterium sp. SC28]